MIANDNTLTRYEVVFHVADRGLEVLRFGGAELLNAMATRGWPMTGTNTNTHQRAELQGQPKFLGLSGPMYGGPGVVRYECATANRHLSV